MSSGRSSHVAACFSVERTKYLMLSKSIPDRSEPQLGIGFLSKIDSALTRRCSIQSGSLFFAEMSRTTASDNPRCALAPATSESAQPKPYRPIASICSSCVRTRSGVVVIWLLPPGLGGLRVRNLGGYVGGADPVAVGDRGQTLDIGAEHLLERPCLRLAQFGELGGDVRHRAVVLADLDPGGRGFGRRSVAIRTEPVGECSGPSGHRR